MNEILIKMENAASQIMDAVMAYSPSDDSYFVLKVGLDTEGQTKPLLIVGNMHRKFDDGNCVVLLNAERSLAEQIKPAVGYSDHILKEIVKGRCEAMSMFHWLAGKTVMISSYRARKKRLC